MVLVGYDAATSRQAVHLAESLPGAVAAVGIHPNSADAAAPADFETIEQLARSAVVVAVGETGLDNYRRFTPPARQRQAFAWHLDLARRVGKPVIVHNRDADQDVLEVVSAASTVGILHCFSSTDLRFLERMLDTGFFVSFAGPLTFKNATRTRDVARQVPADRLLVETDCPYLAPEPHRGRRNEPANVRLTAECLAAVRGLSLELMLETLLRNTLQLFPSLASATREGAA
jgi:TatD DNase family protein